MYCVLGPAGLVRFTLYSGSLRARMIIACSQNSIIASRSHFWNSEIIDVTSRKNSITLDAPHLGTTSSDNYCSSASVSPVQSFHCLKYLERSFLVRNGLGHDRKQIAARVMKSVLGDRYRGGFDEFRLPNVLCACSRDPICLRLSEISSSHQIFQLFFIGLSAILRCSNRDICNFYNPATVKVNLGTLFWLF